MRVRVLSIAAALLFAALAGLPASAGAAPHLYVVNAGSYTVSQFGLDPAGFPSPLGPPTMPALGGSEQIVLSPDGGSAYVTSSSDGRVTQYDVDPVTGALSWKSPWSVVAGDAPVAIALTPDGRSAYVASSTGDRVIEYDVDPADGTLHAKQASPWVPAGNSPRDLAVSPDGTSLYVADEGSDQISQYDIDPADGTLAAKAEPTVGTGIEPLALAVSPDGASLYAASHGSNQIFQYDIDPGDGSLTPKAEAAVFAFSAPGALAVSPDGTNLYALGGGSGHIVRYGIDPGDGSLTQEDKTSLGPDNVLVEIAISPDGRRAYVSDERSGKLLIYPVDPLTGALGEVRKVDTAAPRGIAIAADTSGPSVTIDSGPARAMADRDATFAFAATEPEAGFECALDSAAFQPCSSPWSYSGLADGRHSFRVRASDPWQNIGPAAERRWRVDTSGPSVTIRSGPAGTVTTPDATFAFAASEPGSSFECSLGGGFSACSSPVAYTGLRDGEHLFTVRATDRLGNVGRAVRRRWAVGAARAIPSPPHLWLGRLRRDRRRGTARLAVRVDGPGVVRLAGTRTVRGARRHVAGPGRVWLPVAPKRRARQRLRRRGRRTVSLRVVYRPDSGARQVASRRATLTMRVHRGRAGAGHPPGAGTARQRTEHRR